MSPSVRINRRTGSGAAEIFRAHWGMASSVRALPASGDVFLDARDQGRALRFSWHQERELAVLSIWRGDTCVSSFQLDRDDVPRLVETLVRGLAGQPGHTRAPRLQNLG